MSTFYIERKDHEMLDDTALRWVSAYLFRLFGGHSDGDDRAWKRFWKALHNAEVGEIFVLEFLFQRSTPFHRRHMKIEGEFFKAQERFTNREQFRNWLKIGSGWVDWFPGAKGGVVPVPRSVSYSKADEEQFREYHRLVIEFMRSGHAARRLWPHLDESRGEEMIESILIGFGE